MAGMHRSLILNRSPLVRWLSASCWLIFFLGLSGCASITLNAVQQGQLVVGGPIADVEIIRKGARTQPEPNMALQPDDEIRTGPYTTAVLSFIDGARVFVQPATHVRIGTIFVSIGEVLVKVKGYFQVHTRYATAGSEGTEYLVRVDPGDQVRVVVAEGSVSLVSRLQRWKKVVLGAGDDARIVGAAPPRVGEEAVSPDEIRDIRERIRALDAIVPQPTSVGPLLGAAIAIGAAVAIGRQHGRKDDDARPANDPPRRADRVPAPPEVVPPVVRPPPRGQQDNELR